MKKFIAVIFTVLFTFISSAFANDNFPHVWTSGKGNPQNVFILRQADGTYLRTQLSVEFSVVNREVELAYIDSLPNGAFYDEVLPELTNMAVAEVNPDANYLENVKRHLNKDLEKHGIKVSKVSYVNPRKADPNHI